MKQETLEKLAEAHDWTREQANRIPEEAYKDPVTFVTELWKSGIQFSEQARKKYKGEVYTIDAPKEMVEQARQNGREVSYEREIMSEDCQYSFVGFAIINYIERNYQGEFSKALVEILMNREERNFCKRDQVSRRYSHSELVGSVRKKREFSEDEIAKLAGHAKLEKDQATRIANDLSEAHDYPRNNIFNLQIALKREINVDIIYGENYGLGHIIGSHIAELYNAINKAVYGE